MKKPILVLALISSLVIPCIAYGAGDANAGKAIYKENCARCHGETGAGDGGDAGNMFPKPRDFTSGIFKFKTSSFKEKIPFDRDLFQSVSNGLPGSAMPAWKGSLSIQERWDVVAYIKQIGGISGEAKEQIDYSGWVPPTKANMKKGKELFVSRCAPCHGEDGRGDTTMALEDEWGQIVWPRNFTKFYSFRVGNEPVQIYSRIATGIPGTPMPSFDDPEMGDEQLSNEQKWMVAYYVKSLADKSRVFLKKFGKVVDAWHTDKLPADLKDTKPWMFSKPLTFGLTVLTAPGRPPLNSLVDSLTVRALNDGKEIALLLEWDDNTWSIAEDEDAMTIMLDEDVFNDAIALYMPAGVNSEKSGKPFYGLGDEKTSVNVWRIDSEQNKTKFTLAGSENFESNSEIDAGITMEAMYNKGKWMVLIKRPIQQTGENDAKLEPGKFTPIALSIWDGSNKEEGLTHTFTDWYWLNVLPKGKGGVL